MEAWSRICCGKDRTVGRQLTACGLLREASAPGRYRRGGACRLRQRTGPGQQGGAPTSFARRGGAQPLAKWLNEGAIRERESRTLVYSGATPGPAREGI